MHNMQKMKKDNILLMQQLDTAIKNSHSLKLIATIEEADLRLQQHKQLTSMTDEELQFYIEDQFRKKKLYTDPHLSFKEAALSLGITQDRLRAQFGKDKPLGYFSDYVAELRLIEACQILKEKPIYTMEAVAKDAGFASRKTFQTRFKEKFNMTPSQYRLSTSVTNE